MKNKSMIVMLVMGSIVLLAYVVMYAQTRSVNGILEESMGTSTAVTNDVQRPAQDANVHNIVSHKTSPKRRTHDDEDAFWADQIEFEHTAKELNWQLTD